MQFIVANIVTYFCFSKSMTEKLFFSHLFFAHSLSISAEKDGKKIIFRNDMLVSAIP